MSSLFPTNVSLQTLLSIQAMQSAQNLNRGHPITHQSEMLLHYYQSMMQQQMAAVFMHQQQQQMLFAAIQRTTAIPSLTVQAPSLPIWSPRSPSQSPKSEMEENSNEAMPSAFEQSRLLSPKSDFANISDFDDDGAGKKVEPSGFSRTYARRQLISAIDAVLDDRMSVQRASAEFGVPRSTLRNHVNVQGEKRGTLRVKHRGKYRNYRQGELVQAVMQVRLGRMSIHKAGSMFGIPASTLQYKAKCLSRQMDDAEE